MEMKLGRLLNLSSETVDHINRDKTDDRIENLRIIDSSSHARDDKLRVEKYEITCAWCGERALKEARNLSSNSRQGKAGPFCNRSCAGKYGKSVQMGLEKLPAQSEVEISKRSYYYINKN